MLSECLNRDTVVPLSAYPAREKLSKVISTQKRQETGDTKAQSEEENGLFRETL